MVYILLGNGFEEIEAISPVDLLRRAGVEVKTVSIYPGNLVVSGSHSIGFVCDTSIDKISEKETETVILPGGLGGVRELEASEAVKKLLLECHASGKRIAAICAAPTLLGRLGILDGQVATCYPTMKGELIGCEVSDERVVVSGNFITAEAVGSAALFGLKLVEAIKGAEAAKKVSDAVCY